MSELKTAPSHPELQEALAVHNTRVGEGVQAKKDDALIVVAAAILVCETVQVVLQPELPVEGEA